MTKEIKNKFAILYVQESKLWEICDALDWPKTLKKLYIKHSTKVNAFKKAHFPKQISIQGYYYNDDINHSDIDDALNKAFKGKYVKTDSEGDGFYCYTDKATRQDVCNFLDKKFPDLDYSIGGDDDYNEYIIPFNNWSYAQEYVEKEGIEVPEIFDSNNLIERLKEFDDKINTLKKERHEFLKNIK